MRRRGDHLLPLGMPLDVAYDVAAPGDDPDALVAERAEHGRGQPGGDALSLESGRYDGVRQGQPLGPGFVFDPGPGAVVEPEFVAVFRGVVDERVPLFHLFSVYGRRGV